MNKSNINSNDIYELISKILEAYESGKVTKINFAVGCDLNNEQIEKLKNKLNLATDLIIEIQNYLNFRTDDLVGDDLIGDKKHTNRFNSLLEKINSVLLEIGRYN